MAGKIFHDWRRSRTFREWYNEATDKQRYALDTAGMEMDYWFSLERKFCWSEFNRMVGRAVKMVRNRGKKMGEFIKWREKQKEIAENKG